MWDSLAIASNADSNVQRNFQKLIIKILIISLIMDIIHTIIYVLGIDDCDSIDYNVAKWITDHS